MNRISLPVDFVLQMSMASCVEDILDAIAYWLPSIIEADRASVVLPKAPGKLAVYAFQGVAAIPTDIVLPVRGTGVGEAFRTQKPILLRANETPRYEDHEMLASAGIRSIVNMPLVNGDVCLGTLNVGSQQADAYDSEARDRLQGLATWMATFMRVFKQIAEIERAARTDPLTGVWNRAYFTEQADSVLKRSIHSSEALSLVLFDLDHFKSINDTAGHLKGDQVLKESASRARSAIRPLDLLARWGGEEFAILLPGATLRVAVEIAERVRSSIASEPVSIDDMSVRVSASFGAAERTSDGRCIDELTARADVALYDAKRRGRNRVEAA